MNLRTVIMASVLPLLVCSAAQAANQSPTFAAIPHTPNSTQMALPYSEPPRDVYKGEGAQLRHSIYLTALQKLRREGLALQKQDGGALTDEHRASLQAKLDHLNATWR